MLRAVLADIIRSTWERRVHDKVRSAAPAGPHFTVGLNAILQIPLVPGNLDAIAASCDQLERANHYLPSAYKGMLEHKRFQVYVLRDENARAIDSLRAAIAQAPYNEEFLTEYRKLIPRQQQVSDVTLIVTCKKYEGKALALAAQFENAAINYRIVSGADTAPIAHKRAIQVSADDNYESLPRKVVAAYRWIYENMGSNVGVVKVDDDQNLVDAEKFRARVAELRSRDVYAGVPVSGVTHDRNWHWNKCQDPALNARTYGRPFLAHWAMGGAYYLGPSVLEKVVLFLTRFPGMFEGEYYEDKLVGDVLMFEKVALERLAAYKDFGLALTDEHRFNPPG